MNAMKGQEATTPIEFFPPNRHPFEHLSKLLSSFCNPLDTTGEVDDDEGENDSTPFGDIMLNPVRVDIQDPRRTTMKSCTSNEELEIIMNFEATNAWATSTATATTTAMTTAPVAALSAENRKTPPTSPKNLEGILKTPNKAFKKKAMTVMVDSGRGHRVHRIVETTFFTIIVLVATMVTLRRLGHDVDLSFFPSSNPASFPIQFNTRGMIVEILEAGANDESHGREEEEQFARLETLSFLEMSGDEATHLDENVNNETSFVIVEQTDDDDSVSYETVVLDSFVDRVACGDLTEIPVESFEENVCEEF